MWQYTIKDIKDAITWTGLIKAQTEAEAFMLLNSDFFGYGVVLSLSTLTARFRPSKASSTQEGV